MKNQNLVVIGIVSAGAGATTAAPMVRKVYDGCTASAARRLAQREAAEGLPVVRARRHHRLAPGRGAGAEAGGHALHPAAAAAVAPAAGGAGRRRPAVKQRPLRPPVALRPGRPRRATRAAARAPLRRLDVILLLAVSPLVGVGALLVWSATRRESLDAGSAPTSFLRASASSTRPSAGRPGPGCAASMELPGLACVRPRRLRRVVRRPRRRAVELGSTMNGAHS